MEESQEEDDWPINYFNYFTEIEEHFQKARGSSVFLLSPLDWALIEGWKSSGVPLRAVLQGIDDAFEKRRARRVKNQQVNSIAYCTQAILEAAKRLPDETNGSSKATGNAPFAPTDVIDHLRRAAAQIRERERIGFDEIVNSLEQLAQLCEQQPPNLEELELRLTAMEERTIALARTQQSDDDIFAMRESLNAELKPYRSKMTADQLAMLEKRYLENALLERTGLPRLSLFYIR